MAPGDYVLLTIADLNCVSVCVRGVYRVILAGFFLMAFIDLPKVSMCDGGDVLEKRVFGPAGYHA